MRRDTQEWYEGEIERLIRERDNALVRAASTARDANRQCTENERLDAELVVAGQKIAALNERVRALSDEAVPIGRLQGIYGSLLRGMYDVLKIRGETHGPAKETARNILKPLLQAAYPERD